jgi:hypothetical protein
MNEMGKNGKSKFCTKVTQIQVVRGAKIYIGKVRGANYVRG